MKRITWLILLGIMVLSLPLVSCSGAAAAKITIATDATWPPFESVNEQSKQIEGFDVDIMKAIADKEKLDIEFKNVAWDPLLAGMAQGTYDAAISSITILDERKKDMLFSDPYFAAGQIVVVRKDNTSITSKDNLTGNVGVQLGTTGDLEVQKIKTATSKPYDDIGLAFQDLMNGQVNAVVCDNPVATQYVNKNPAKLKTAGSVFTDENYGIAVAKGKTDLLAKINDGLKALKAEGFIDKTAQVWLK